MESVPQVITEELVERFIQDRKVWIGCTASTLSWYRQSLSRFTSITLDRPSIQQRISELAAKGNQNISINTWLCGLRAFLNWGKKEGIFREIVEIPKLKQSRKLLNVFSPDDVQKLLRFSTSFKRSTNVKRIWAIGCFILDTGVRMNEVSQLKVGDVDIVNCIVRVHGKGDKYRDIPLSRELRTRLKLWLANRDKTDYLFQTSSGRSLSHRNIQRDFKTLCTKIGIDTQKVRCSPHTLRHTFAVMYLRNGGNIYFLRNILGHSSVQITEEYLKALGVVDLQNVHEKLSPLTRSMNG